MLPQTDSDLLEQIIATQLERRGFKLEQDSAGKNYRWHLLGTQGGQCIVSVDLLADPFPTALAAQHASDYTAALRLAQLPTGHLVIIEEQGDLVLAASHQGKLYHSHIFAQTPATEETLALEITLARLTLESELGIDSITGVALVGANFERAICTRLSSVLELPVRIVADLPPNTALDTRDWGKMLPADIRHAQISQHAPWENHPCPRAGRHAVCVARLPGFRLPAFSGAACRALTEEVEAHQGTRRRRASGHPALEGTRAGHRAEALPHVPAGRDQPHHARQRHRDP
jgi:hypothetical protein